MKILLVHYFTLLCTFVKNLDCLSIHPEIHNKYITHDVLELESHKNKDSASLVTGLKKTSRPIKRLMLQNK